MIFNEELLGSSNLINWIVGSIYPQSWKTYSYVKDVI